MEMNNDIIKESNEDMKRNKKIRLLFVCSKNVDRSVIAQRLYDSHDKYEALSCGVSYSAYRRADEEIVDWSDIIIVMDEKNEEHKTSLIEQVPTANEKEIIILDIPNTLICGSGELIELMLEKLRRHGLWHEDIGEKKYKAVRKVRIR
jgi:predicted protein tyrosine phosphatase